MTYSITKNRKSLLEYNPLSKCLFLPSNQLSCTKLSKVVRCYLMFDFVDSFNTWNLNAANGTSCDPFLGSVCVCPVTFSWILLVNVSVLSRRYLSCVDSKFHQQLDWNPTSYIKPTVFDEQEYFLGLVKRYCVCCNRDTDRWVNSIVD